jgi:hypothetical protein
MKKVKLTIAIAAALLSLASCTNNYSEGERVGIITKFSNQGLIWKSHEGDLKVAPGAASGGMIGQYEHFDFSIDNDNTIKCETSLDTIMQYMKEGISVVLIYQQVKGMNWFDNRGKTDYFVKQVKRAK